MGFVVLWDFKRLRDELRLGVSWFLAGCGVTAISLVIQFAFIDRAPQVDAAFSTSEISGFIRYWDGHRQPVDITNNGVSLNFGALAIASLWLTVFARELPRSSIFLLRVTVVIALMGIALVFVSWIPPDRLPTTLLVMMPGRVLNFNALTFGALIVGLLGSYRRTVWSQAWLLLLLVGLIVGDHSMLWEWLRMKRGIYYESHVRPLWVVTAACGGLIAGAGWTKCRSLDRPAERAARVRAPVVYSTLRTLSLAMLVVVIVLTLGFSRPISLSFRDRTNDAFFWQVASGHGLLLTAADLHLIQLRTRRPVLLDGGGLDGLLYSLEAGHEMERILRDVYGVDLLNPPEEARGAGRLPPLTARKTWEVYSPEKWQEIKRTYGVTQVLTYPEWTLRLPIAAQSRRFLLYQIP